MSNNTQEEPREMWARKLEEKRRAMFGDWMFQARPDRSTGAEVPGEEHIEIDCVPKTDTKAGELGYNKISPQIWREQSVSTYPSLEARVNALERQQTILNARIEDVSLDMKNSIKQLSDSMAEGFKQLAERQVKIEQEMNNRFNQVGEEFSKIDEEFSQIDEGFSQVDEHFKQVETSIKQLDDNMVKSFNQVADYQIKTEKEINEHFKQVDKRFNQVEERFKQVDKRFNQVDTRLDKVENRLDKVEGRLGNMESLLTQILERLPQNPG